MWKQYGLLFSCVYFLSSSFSKICRPKLEKNFPTYNGAVGFIDWLGLISLSVC